MFARWFLSLLLLQTRYQQALSTPAEYEVFIYPHHEPSGANPPCFPALNFTMPDVIPPALSAGNWWCDPLTEYAFLGFSYEVTQCPTAAQLHTDFADIRKRFSGRYVRLYGACDRDHFYDDIIDAAWDNTLGVHALIWFGFDGSDEWIGRRDELFYTLHNNPKAPFVIRAVQFGSEPLFDHVLPPEDLTQQVVDAKRNLSSLGISVTVSDMAAGYQENGGAQDVLDAVDFFDIHTLPFFSTLASTADLAWPIVSEEIRWFMDRGNGKKMYLDENGWPSVTSDGVQPNSPDAVADVANEKAYYTLLDERCPDLKALPAGGVGWFAHIYSDEQEPGYGIYDSDGQLKFPFAPRISC